MRFVTILLLSLFPVAAAAQSYTPIESPITQNSGRFGQAVAVGDLDGDEAVELVISTRESEPSNENATGAGRVYVLDADGTVLLTLNPPNPEEDGSFGQAVAVGGDADNDGGNDVFVCAPNEDPNGLDRAGQLHVFSGASGAFIRTQPSPNPQEQAFFCTSITTVEDLDDDGEADVLVGASSEDGGAGGAGRVYVFSGAEGTLLKTYDALDPDGEAAFGNGLAAAGDLNNDGTPDLFVAATIRSGETGKVHVISGVDGALLFTITSPSDQEDDAFANGFGNGLTSVPDLNGDGLVQTKRFALVR